MWRRAIVLTVLAGDAGTGKDRPWSGRGWSYEVRDGIRIPLEAEVAWSQPSGPSPYWRGRIASIEYEYPR